MKCNICHNEFGEGELCQACNADKSTASSSPIDKDSQATIDTNKVICHHCAKAIPTNSEFCPFCGIVLYKTCYKCGNKFSSQYEFCNSCGANMGQFSTKEKEEAEIIKRTPEYKKALEYVLTMYKQYISRKHNFKKTTIIIISLFIGICAGLGLIDLIKGDISPYSDTKGVIITLYCILSTALISFASIFSCLNTIFGGSKSGSTKSDWNDRSYTKYIQKYMKHKPIADSTVKQLVEECIKIKRGEKSIAEANITSESIENCMIYAYKSCLESKA